MLKQNNNLWVHMQMKFFNQKMYVNKQNDCVKILDENYGKEYLKKS